MIRNGRRRAGTLLTGLVTGLAVALIAAAVLVASGGLRVELASFSPFQEKTVDRTGPSVLKSLTDLSEFHAASAYYETVVDIEKDTSYIPGWFSGERVLYVGKGQVNGVVSFSERDRNVVLSEDGTTITITLPGPSLSEPILDLESSYVVEHSEGIASKFSGSDLEREAQLKAVEQMTAAADDDSALADLTKANTITMLQGLLGSLGYTDVEVTFDDALL